MMKTRGKLVRFGTGALLVGALSVTGLHAAASEVEVITGATGLWFQLSESQDSVLTVSGVGVDIQREFEAGEAPQFDGLDDNGNPLPDGYYSYDFRTVPEQNQKALAEADEANDAARLAELWEEAQTNTQVAGGELEIANGQFVLPDEAGDEAGE